MKYISCEEYNKAKETIRLYELQDTGLQCSEEDTDDIEPCPTCGEIDGMVNICCVGYDPLHYKNCGYG